MLVHQILKSKSDDAVVTVVPGSTIASAAKVLAERRIGTVVISTAVSYTHLTLPTIYSV